MKRYFILLLLTVFLFGCVETENDGKVDVRVQKVYFEDEKPKTLGSKVPLVFELSADKPVEYTFVVKTNGEKVYEKTYTGNVSDKVYIPIMFDGNVNLSAQVFVKDSKKYYDVNFSNDFITKELKFHPMGIYSNVSFTNSSRIHDKRIVATRLTFDSDAYIYTIGFLVRRTAIFSPNSTIYVTLYRDNGGTPGEKVLGMNTSFLHISNDWRIVLLQNQPSKVSAGSYWLSFYVDNEGYAEILCKENTSGVNIVGNKFPDGEVVWSEAKQECTPYYIVSSQNPVETYKEYAMANNLTIS